MAQPFELSYELDVPATPEEVWDAITDGPKVDSWFLGKTRIEPRQGGTTTFEFVGGTSNSAVTEWQPPHRLRYEGEPAEDGAFHVFEYTVEPRGAGSSVKWVHSGALGPNWEAEYAGMSEGDPMYFHKLGVYLTHFKGRIATPIDAFGPR